MVGVDDDDDSCLDDVLKSASLNTLDLGCEDKPNVVDLGQFNSPLLISTTSESPQTRLQETTSTLGSTFFSVSVRREKVSKENCERTEHKSPMLASIRKFTWQLICERKMKAGRKEEMFEQGFMS